MSISKQTANFSCRLCGNETLHLYMSDGRHRDLVYYRCAVCKLSNYDLSAGLDQTQYTEVYVSPEDESARQNQVVTSSWSYLHQRFPKPGRILDIGCGNGRLLYLARREGWEVKGLELSSTASQNITAETGIEVETANFLEYRNIDNDRYDIVVLRHILEHLPDPKKAMQQIHGLLEDHGHALLEFPNTKSFGYAYKRVLKNNGLKNKKYTEQWRPGHCNEYCREAFEYLVSVTGFELIDWQTYSSKPVMNAIYRLFPIASKARALIRKSSG